MSKFESNICISINKFIFQFKRNMVWLNQFATQFITVQNTIKIVFVQYCQNNVFVTHFVVVCLLVWILIYRKQSERWKKVWVMTTPRRASDRLFRAPCFARARRNGTSRSLVMFDGEVVGSFFFFFFLSHHFFCVRKQLSIRPFGTKKHEVQYKRSFRKVVSFTKKFWWHRRKWLHRLS